MTNNYQIMNNDYFNAGGNNMVNITDVYNRQLKKMQYVFFDETNAIIADYDYIRNELPTTTTYEDFIVECVAVEDISHEPAPVSSWLDIGEDKAQLIFDCYLLFIREYCKYSKDNYICRLDSLPNELYDKVTREYSHWLAENGLDPVTDGYSIIIHPEYTAENEPLEMRDNGNVAVELEQHLNSWMPASNEENNEEAWDEFYREKIHIIVGGKLFTFDNGADIYNALGYLAKNVIDEQ